MHFSLQANRKTREGDHHPDRDAQFAYLNTAVSAAPGPRLRGGRLCAGASSGRRAAGHLG
jgi:hypothetical protein